MTTDKQREAFENAAEPILGYKPTWDSLNNKYRCVNGNKYYALWQAALSQQPVSEEEIATRIYYAFADAGKVGIREQSRQAARALLARFNISDRGK